ncbi:hypothetical protein pb186bvf_019391 [Paramecium bursaria]
MFYESIITLEVKHSQHQGKKKVNDYVIGKRLGEGSFGLVRAVTRLYKEPDDDNLYTQELAMKIFWRTALQNQRVCMYEVDSKQPRLTNLLEFAINELNIWKYLDHKNICKLYEIIDDDNDPKEKIYAVMQLGDLGTLMEYLDNDIYKRNQKYLEYLNIQDIEQSAIYIFRQIAYGIEYLHQNYIVNRDIKLENIIITTQYGPDESVKITDFSTSRQALEGQRSYDCAGTSGFRAPEVQFSLDEGYDPFKLDIWGFGICLYTYMHEKLPFFGDCELQIDCRAKNEEPDIQLGSKLYRDIVLKCLSKNPDERPTIEQLLQHNWFNQ